MHAHERCNDSNSQIHAITVTVQHTRTVFKSARSSCCFTCYMQAELLQAAAVSLSLHHAWDSCPSTSVHVTPYSAAGAVTVAAMYSALGLKETPLSGLSPSLGYMT